MATARAPHAAAKEARSQQEDPPAGEDSKVGSRQDVKAPQDPQPARASKGGGADRTAASRLQPVAERGGPTQGGAQGGTAGPAPAPAVRQRQGEQLTSANAGAHKQPRAPPPAAPTPRSHASATSVGAPPAAPAGASQKASEGQATRPGAPSVPQGAAAQPQSGARRGEEKTTPARSTSSFREQAAKGEAPLGRLVPSAAAGPAAPQRGKDATATAAVHEAPAGAKEEEGPAATAQHADEGVADTVGKGAAPASETAGKGACAAAETAGKGPAAGGARASSAAQSVAPGPKTDGKGAAEQASTAAKSVVPGLEAAGKGAVAAAQAARKGAATTADSASSAAQSVAPGPETVCHGAVAAAETAGKGAATAIEVAGKGAGAAAERASSAVQGVVPDPKAVVQGLQDTASSAADAVSGAVQGAGRAPDTAAQAAKNAVAAVTDAAGAPVEAAAASAAAVAQGAASAVSGGAATVQGAAASTVGGALRLAREVVGRAVSMAGAALTAAAQVAGVERPEQLVSSVLGTWGVREEGDECEGRSILLKNAAQVPPILPAVMSPKPSAKLSEQQGAVVGCWHAMYTAPSEAAQAAALREGYAASAAFEDNLFKVYGHAHIGAQFYALWQLVDRVDVDVLHIALEEGAAARDAALRLGVGSVRPWPLNWAATALLPGMNGGAAGTPLGEEDVYVVHLINVQRCCVPGRRLPLAALVLPEAVPLLVRTTLVVRSSDHKVLHHRDAWANLPSLHWAVRGQLGGWSSWAMNTLLGW